MTSGLAQWAFEGSEFHAELLAAGWNESFRKPVFVDDTAILMTKEIPRPSACIRVVGTSPEEDSPRTAGMSRPPGVAEGRPDNFAARKQRFEGGAR